MRLPGPGPALILALILAALRCPAAAPLPPSLAETHLFRAWNRERIVRCLARTPDGYLWAGGFSGLTRFDGNRSFAWPGSSLAPGMANGVSALAPEGNQFLWIGTDTGLCRLERGGLVTTWPTNTLPSAPVRSITITEPGGVFVSFADATPGVFRLASGTWSPEPTPPTPPGTPWRLVHASDHTLYAWNPRQLARRESDGSWTLVASPPEGDAFRGAAAARTGGIWVANGSHVRHWHSGGWTQQRARPEGFTGDVVEILEDTEGQLWLGCFTQGLVVVGPDGPVGFARAREGLPNISVTALFATADGGIWGGSNGGGLVQIQPRGFRSFSFHEGLEQTVVNSMAELDEGAIAVGTHGGGIQILRNGRFDPPLRFDHPPDRKWVHALARDRSGTLWVGTLENGLFSWDGSGPVRLRFPASATGSSSINGLFADSRGRVWVGGNQSLAVVENGQLRQLGAQEGAPPAGTRIWGIQEGRDGSIWVLAAGGQLLRSHDGNRFSPVALDAHAATNSPLRLWISPGDDVWLGCSNGSLGRLRNGALRWLDGSLHGPVEQVFSLLGDDRSGLWVCGDNGIGRIDLDAAGEFLDGRTNRIRSWRFDASDGLDDAQGRLNYFPNALRTSDGRVWFATLQGVASANPGQLRPHRGYSAAVIESITLPGDTSHPIWGLRNGIPRLPAGTRVARVRYTSPQLGAPERMQFQYRLGDATAPWIDGVEAREIDLVQLAPGRHSIAVRCRLAGVPSWSAPTIVDFDVDALWWERPRVRLAAVVLLALAFGAAMWLWIESRFRRQQAAMARDLEMRQLAREKELAEKANVAKSEFVALISHELRTPLHGLLGYADLLGDTPLTQTQRSYLATARHSAESLLQLINEVLDHSRLESGRLDLIPEPCSLRQQIRSALDLLATRALERGLDFVSRTDPTLPDFILVDPQRLQQILVNLVGNAIKFTPAGHIHVLVNPAPESPAHAEILVADSGIGIAPEIRSRLFQRFVQGDGSNTRRYGGTGLGLAICKGLIEQMGGSITCSSQPGVGTTFRLLLPLHPPPQESPTIPPPSLPWPVVDCAFIGTAPFTTAALRAWLPQAATNAAEFASLDALETWLRQPGIGIAEPPTLFVGSSLAEAQPRFAFRALRMAARNGRIRIVLVADPRHVRPLQEAINWGCDHFWRQPYTSPPEPVGDTAQKPGHSEAAPHTAPRSSIPVPSQPRTAPGSSAQKRVLLVEDHPVNQAYARDALLGLGCEVDIAGNGRDAVELARARRYDLILMDCQMPEIDGWEATRQIRASEPPGQHVRIVALTAGAYEGDRERCIEAGMDDYVPKPFRIEDLRRIVG